MKIELEKIFFYSMIVILPLMSLYFVTSHTDNYLHYVVGEEIFEKPTRLINGRGFTTNDRIFVYKDSPYFYPPLGPLFYGLFISMGLSPSVFDAILIVLVVFITWKVKKESLPLFFLSFMFIRILIFGANDSILLVLTLLSYYFFDKKPILSGIFVGMCPLVKGTGFIVLGTYVLSIFIFKKKEIFKKDFYKNKYFLSLVVIILLLSPWYLRNYIYTKDLVWTISGQKVSNLKSSEEWLESGIQSNQPERSLIDRSGFYPLPIDILLLSGTIFSVFNLFKTKKLTMRRLFIFVFLLVFYTVQILGIDFLMSWRYYIVIFPFLCMEIVDALSEKYMKYLYGLSIILMLVWLFLLPKYSYNKFVKIVDSWCTQIESRIGEDKVYLKSYHDWAMIYRCDMNTVPLNESVWVVDVYNGTIKRTEEYLNGTSKNIE